MADRPIMVVTGGSRGIGAAVVRAAAPRYDIVLSFHEQSAAATEVERAATALGAQVWSVRADVATEDGARALFAAVDAAGGVDVLVNNAGIAGAYGPLSVVDEPMLTRLWAVNVTGPFLCAREAAGRMRNDRGGRGGSIVNISSKAAVLGGSGEWVHYAASKGAIDTMTTGLAKELAPFGVRVNGVRPGLIESDFHLHAPAGRVERIAPTVPMLRSGTADEVAAAVLWLASAEAGYVTGAFLDVAGGR